MAQVKSTKLKGRNFAIPSLNFCLRIYFGKYSEFVSILFMRIYFALEFLIKSQNYTSQLLFDILLEGGDIFALALVIF